MHVTDAHSILLCRVHDIFRTRLPFTNAAYWTCASSLSLTPTPFLPPSLPWVAFPELNSTNVQAFVQETFPGNSVWFSLLSFGSPWHCISLHYITWYCIILCYLILHYTTLLHIAVILTTHCCCNCFLLDKNNTFFACWLNGFPL
jgi:hypothetical protein